MLDDFTPIVHELPGRTIRVWAVADVHIGAKECDLDGFQKFIETKVLGDPDGYVVLCGDLLNNGIKDSLTSVYEETMPPSAQVDKCVEILAPVAHKILGCVGGNHEHRTKKAVDVDIMHQVMTRIGVPDLYRPNMAFVRVNLVQGRVKDHYALLLVHGKTAGKQKMLSYAIEGVDAIVGAHLHQGSIQKNARIVLSRHNTVRILPIVNMTATSWLQYGGYAARSLLLPGATSDPQCLVLEFTGSNNSRGSIRVAW